VPGLGQTCLGRWAHVPNIPAQRVPQAVISGHTAAGRLKLLGCLRPATTHGGRPPAAAGRLRVRRCVHVAGLLARIL
jgi:hypothetical protein